MKLVKAVINPIRSTFNKITSTKHGVKVLFISMFGIFGVITVLVSHAQTTVIDATVNVSSTPVARAIPNGFIGLSLEKTFMANNAGILPAGKDRVGDNLFDTANHADFKNLIANLGDGTLRIGANGVEDVVWSDASCQTVTGDVRPIITADKITKLAQFSKQTGWGIIYAVALRTSNPTCAASEASAAQAIFSAQGGHLVGIEVGNEPNAYSKYNPVTKSTESIYKDDIKTYTSDWQRFADAMIAKTPQIALIGASSSGSRLTNWSTELSKLTANKPAMVTQHFYRSEAVSSLPAYSPKTPKVGEKIEWTDKDKRDWNDKLLQYSTDPNALIMGKLNELQASFKATGVPYRIDETNAYTAGTESGANNITNSFAAGLWSLDFMMQNALHDSAGINLHTNGRNGNAVEHGGDGDPKDVSTIRTLGGGVEHGYSPIYIQSPENYVKQVRAEYYAMMLFNQLGKGVLLKTDITTTGNMSAYSVKTPTGYKVLLINKDRDASVNTTISSGDTLESAYRTDLLAPSLEDAPVTGTNPLGNVTLGGKKVSIDGAQVTIPKTAVTPAGTKLTIVVKPGSAVLVEVNISSSCGKVLPGAKLSSGQILQSCDGQYSLSMQADGNLVLRGNGGTTGGVLWNTKTFNHPGAILTMQTDGNLVLRSTTGAVLWDSKTSGHTNSTVRIEGKGNLVVRDSTGLPLWDRISKP